MSIWNEIEKISKRNGKRNAIGEASEDIVIFRNYEKLMSDALGAACLLLESCEKSIIAVELGAYDTAVFVLACSRAEARLVFSEGDGNKRGIFIGAEFISSDQIGARLSGILSSPYPPELPNESGNAFFTFRDGVTYSEEAALISAQSFAEGCSILRPDRLMYLLSPNTAEGLFCGILAPLIKGASSVRCSDARNMLRCMKLTSPTRLFCGELHARALLLKLLRIKKIKLREINKAESENSLKLLTDPTWMMIRRLIRPNILYALGGKLKTVAVLGDLSQRRTRAFFSFGIFAISVRTEKGLCPSLFHYGGDKRGVWRLPRDSFADICRAEKGGVGKIIISSPALREGESLDRTYLSLEKHFDGEKTALVTTLSGYILKDGNVFVTKQRNI